jgi:hypothetical protein
MATRSRFFLPVIVVPVAALATWQQHPHSHSRMLTQGPNWTELTGSMGTMHVGMASIEPSVVRRSEPLRARSHIDS